MIRRKNARSRLLKAGAALLHNHRLMGSENCVCTALTQDYFASDSWLVQRPMFLITVSMQGAGESSAEKLIAYGGVQRLPTSKAELFQRRDFLTREHCDELIRLIDKDRRPSTIADDNGDAYFRTSETCDLAVDELAVQRLEALLFDLNGIDPAHGEPVQGQRYGVGQEFKAHTDYFTPGGADFEKYCSMAGNRTWTFMIYLNAVEAGGATRFKAVGKSFQPESGKLLCWNNKRTDGRVNPNTLHHGMKVRKGVKYVITKWYREKPWGWE